MPVVLALRREGYALNIGYSAVGSDRLELGRFNATSTTIKAMRIDQVGIEPCMYEAAATWPNWPATATFTRYAPALAVYYMSIFFTEGEDDEAGISSITAYISHLFDPGGAWVPEVVFQAALYDADANLLGTTVQVTRTPAERPPAWVEFPFTTPLSREAGEPLYIALWAAPPPDFLHRYTTYVYADQGGYADQDYWQPIPPDQTEITIIDNIVVPDDEPIGFKHGLTVNDAVVADASQTPTLVSPCFGRYIELETMLRISTPRQVSSEGTVTPPDPLPPDA